MQMTLQQSTKESHKKRMEHSLNIFVSQTCHMPHKVQTEGKR